MTIEEILSPQQTAARFGEHSEFYENPYFNRTPSQSSESLILNETEGKTETCMARTCRIFSKFLDFIIPKSLR